jgi:hypothetical protein
MSPDGGPSVLAWRINRIAQSQADRRRLVIEYGVCVRCAAYQVLHASGLCWDCTYMPQYGYPRRRQERGQQSVVYYAALTRNLIKIGTTAQLYTRMHQLGARLLGYEPGSYELETTRKRQFAPLRASGPGREWFRPEPELMEHIRQLPGHPHCRIRCRG